MIFLIVQYKYKVQTVPVRMHFVSQYILMQILCVNCFLPLNNNSSNRCNVKNITRTFVQLSYNVMCNKAVVDCMIVLTKYQDNF